jgi:hypothetical protein
MTSDQLNVPIAVLSVKERTLRIGRGGGWTLVHCGDLVSAAISVVSLQHSRVNLKSLGTEAGAKSDV